MTDSSASSHHSKLHLSTHIPFESDLKVEEVVKSSSSIEVVSNDTPSPPPAAAKPIAPPPAVITPPSVIKPFNPMVGMLAGKGGIGGALGIGGAKPFLKSTKRATTFVLKGGSKLVGKVEDWSVTPTERMRNIDELRKHIPTPEECDLLNIPDDRLFADNMKDVLYLSGGCAGVRFSTSELRSLQNLVANISDLCKTLEKSFRRLSPEQTKISIDAILHTNKPNRSDTNPWGDYNKITYFHGVADDLLNLIDELQRVVSQKQKSIDKTASKMKFDSDPDGGAAPRPKWLDVLMQKFDKHFNVHDPTLTSKTTVLLSKGKLASFISYCLVDDVPCSKEEREAMEEVNIRINAFNFLSVCLLPYICEYI